MKRLVSSAILLVVSVLLAGFASGVTTGPASAHSISPKPSRPLARPITFTPQALRNITAQRAADKVSPAAETDLSGHFAGIAITAAGGLEISVTGMPSAVFRARIQAAAGAVPIAYRLVTHSERILDSLTMRIASDQAWWARRGVGLSSWGPSYVANKVIVSLARYTHAAAAAIVRRYGAALVEVRTSSVPLATRAGRTSDSSPWYGGDLINNRTEGIDCTSGFGLQDTNGADFALTAGHCGDNGDSFYNGSRFMGKANNRNFTQDGWDAELIPTLTTGYIWGGGPSGTTVREVVAVASSDPIGGLTCTDGSFTGEVCGVRIDQVNQCITFSDGVTTCHLVISSKANTTICQPGDSGGPVETTLPSGNTEARGEIVGEAGGSTCYYTPIREIASLYNVRVLEG